MRIFKHLEAFFFRPVSATGFGLLRMGWGAAALFIMLQQWADVTRYYSDRGVLPWPILSGFARTRYRFCLFDYVTDPHAVFAVYLFFLLLCVFLIIGQWPRLSMIGATVIYFSFHEKNPLILSGGETLMRDMAVILCVAPGLSALSRKRWRRQWTHWKSARTLLPPQTQPAWPYRLLLWQVFLVYSTSVWDKLLGWSWTHGTAVAVALHNPHFSRLPRSVQDATAFLSPVLTYATLLYELSWLLMLLPRSVTQRFRWTRDGRLKRLILLGGLAFHLGILLTMDVSSFSYVMFVSYLGLLLQEDLGAIRRLFGRRKPVVMLYDGECGLCRRSAFTVAMLDWLHRMRLVDFRDTEVRKEHAPDLTLKDLDRSMHVRLPDGRYRKGFYAFRVLAARIPAAWPLWPFLYVPGVPWIGERIYRRIADNRNKCAHGKCNI
jgi:predicted DCC family thiol-disulfide oxidoreductase YuxK